MIPAGEFWMGSRKEKKPSFFDRLLGQSAGGQAESSTTPVDPNAYDSELPQHRLHLPAYRIARTPVTNVQFQPFVAANGYTTQSFWSTSGWQWRTHHGITEPRYWQDGKWNGAKQPVVEADRRVRLVVRGGAWSLDRFNVRAARRYSDTPDYRVTRLGFRVVLVVAPR